MCSASEHGEDAARGCVTGVCLGVLIWVAVVVGALVVRFCVLPWLPWCSW